MTLAVSVTLLIDSYDCSSVSHIADWHVSEKSQQSSSSSASDERKLSIQKFDSSLPQPKSSIRFVSSVELKHSSGTINLIYSTNIKYKYFTPQTTWRPIEQCFLFTKLYLLLVCFPDDFKFLPLCVVLWKASVDSLMVFDSSILAL